MDLSERDRILLSWRGDFGLCVRQVFGASPEPWQDEAFRLFHANDRISIRSGHGVGKTAWLAWLIWCWLLTRFPARVPCTAPTSTQLNDVLWAELSLWHQRMDPALRQLFEIKADEVVLKENPKLSCALARTARKEQPEAFQGQHSDNLLFIVDEASGVDDVIFETGQGSMSTPGAKTVMTSNPTRTSGYFYDSHHRMRRFWATMKVSCEESSRVSPSYIEEMGEKWGRDSNIFKVRVLGEFPSTEDDAVIPLELVEAAVDRDVDDVGGAVVWGLDVARFGDDASALAKRQSNRVLEPVRTWKGKDLMQTTGIVVREWEDAIEKPAFIYVDSIGLGAGVVDRLCELGIPAVGINVSESAAVGERYMRLRDELWFTVKEWFAARDVKIPADEGLIGELTSPKYNFTSSGKLKVEGKDQMKKRGVQSPNKADALCLTFAGGFKTMTYENVQMDPEWFPDV